MSVIARDSFEFQKCGQLFIRTHNETPSVISMCVSNPDRSPLGINRCDTAPTPTGFAEIVCDDFPVHVYDICPPKDCRGFDDMPSLQ